jgi:light-regulated signal transduction histidine kinase (bacteriophytochrome)
LIHPDDLGAIRGSSEALAKGEIDMFQVEYRCRHKNGSWRYLEGIARRYDDDSVDLHGIIVNSRDVTDRKSAERQLRSYTAKLEQSNRELQEFAYVASHDLQEPLRKVQAFGDRLEKKCAAALSDEGRDYVGRMRNAAGRMQNLINDLLTFSRVATKTQPFRGVDLKRIVEEVASDLEVRIEQTGGRVEIGELPLIDADALQMRQLFQNLIGNALKFHRADAAPLVKIYAETVSTNGASFSLNGEEIQTAGDESFCRIVVEDNGIGFDEKYLDRIFTVFQRLHGRMEYEGSGIGLAVCRKIVERHGGQISANSKEGMGARFYIDLPLTHEEDTNIHETKC